VLASASPRRRELLARLVAEFESRPSDVDETPRPGESPRALVERLALAKAEAAARPGEIALGADTEVALDGEVLGKPADAGAARRMLRRLAGREHEVWSGVALVDRRGERTRREVGSGLTKVRFRALADAEIAAYADSGEPLDKAGAYAIQGGAAGFVAGLDGELTNVVGLPLPLVGELLARAGIPMRA
jgi:septum formation protein